MTDAPFVLERGGVSEPQYAQVPEATRSPADQSQLRSVDPGISVLQWRPDLGERGGPGTTPPIWGDVPPRNLNFTGREDLLAALDAKLRAGGPAVVVPQALYGMGGIGKTQTAIEYVYRHLDDYDVVWWIDAAQATQIRSSLTELAGRLGLPGGTEANTAVPAVREALRLGKPYTRWLLVFDAAESVDAIKEFFPTVSANGSGDILITSRNPDWQSLASPLEVSTFDRSESIELLRRRGPDIEEEDADRLADTLGDLPLAIEQAATWRAETGMPVDEYLRLFDEKMAEILGTMAPANYELPVAAAWNVAFDALRTRNPAAHQMLQICGFFSSEPISRQIFSGVRDAIAPEIDRALRDPIELSRAIRDIRRYGLAKIDHRTKTIQLHRLVQMVLRNRMSPEQQGETLHAAHRLLASYDPRDPNSSRNWERYRDLLPHVYAANLIECPDQWARELVVNLMRYLYRWGDHDEAINLAERTLARWRKSPGEEDAQTLKVASELGSYYWYTGNFEKSAALNLRTLDIRRSVDGENSEETFKARIWVAADLKAKGDFGAAMAMTADVYNKARALFTEDDPATLQFARQHAVNLRLVGEYQQAAKLDTDTYSRLIEILGSEHTETLSALSGLVIDRREAGEYLWARAEHEKLAEEAQRIHGADSADALRRLAYLAVARRKAGDHEGALELSTEVLNRFQIRYGPGNFNALACALGKSIDLRHAGDLRGAKELGEDAMMRYRTTMGDDHPYTKCAEVDLAVTLRLLGDPTAARAINERAADALRHSLGADHPYTVLCTINLASDISAVGETDAAIVLTTDALERSERVLGPDHPTTLAASLNLVIDLRTAGRGQEAEKRYADVLTRYRQVLGPEHRATVNAGRGVRADCDIDPLPM
ncbi:FxSxx-COOH system tetratricopeptide repeat protein [Kibdelosporangium lantanae]|uniref:FxSxx-COOH system tetratricopeptide repeat protein n=1 Tax=Kibdelosporangium lantanae TaxID=1497396 RepID=A0ABW3M448_9PSEU